MEKNIEILIEKIQHLPKGYISNKTIGGKVRHYLQWAENGKTKSQYIPDEDYEKIKFEIAKRKELQKELKAMQNNKSVKPSIEYETNVTTGNDLKVLVNYVEKFKKRDCYKILNDYLYSEITPRICSIYVLIATSNAITYEIYR